MSYRVYIDESGDHTYKGLDDPHRRYLGLTAIVIRKTTYNPHVSNSLEALKKEFFTYDPDNPPILTRKQIIQKKGPFWVLRDKDTNAEWEEKFLALLRRVPMQVFTVVIDKKEHYERFEHFSWNPYDYGLTVLLNRVKGWLNIQMGVADIMPESRGNKEDNQLLAAYIDLRTLDSEYTRAADIAQAFPSERLLFRRKDQNIAGLQLADIIAAEQKMLTVEESDKPLARSIGGFGQRVNKAISGKVNAYGRYLLV